MNFIQSFLSKFFIYSSCLYFLSVGIFSCNTNDSDLNRVLAKAGTNGVELQKVLTHYREGKEPLKYKAAVFLIVNMENKYAYTGKTYFSFIRSIDSLSALDLTTKEFTTLFRKLLDGEGNLQESLEKTFDIENISSKFLIDIIDESFEIYHDAPWCRGMDFDEFCDYILPYRIGHEPLQDFKRLFYKRFFPLTRIPGITMQMAADSILKITSAKEVSVITFKYLIPDLPVNTLLSLKAGSCREYSSLAIYIMRSIGLPVAFDYTPQWPHRGTGHSWCSLIVKKDSCIDFEGSNAQKIGNHLRLSTTNRMAKAFRRLFSIQKSSLALQHNIEHFPDVFADPCIVDVSKFYFNPVTIRCHFDSTFARQKYAYLAVFDNTEWEPIFWARIKDGEAVFNNMGKSVVYLPVVYENNSCTPAGQPILVDSMGNIKEIIADESHRQNVVLKRKYPVFDWWNTRTLAMKNGKFQAADHSDFRDAKTLFEIRNVPEMTYQTVDIEPDRAYKFWRYLSPKNSFGSVAEVEFISSHAEVLKGKIMGTTNNCGKIGAKEAFDGDPLTAYEGDRPDSNWVGIGLQKPDKVQRIRYLCWNDDNFIKRGESYELYYWKESEWNTLGARVGDDSQVLTYKSMPTAALFLLRNHSKGKEERIFTYEKDKQTWW